MAVNSDAVVEGARQRIPPGALQGQSGGTFCILDVSRLLSNVSIAAPDIRRQARSGLGLDGVHVVSRKGRPSPLPASGFATEAHPVSFACPSRATESFPDRRYHPVQPGQGCLQPQLVGRESRRHALLICPSALCAACASHPRRGLVIVPGDSEVASDERHIPDHAQAEVRPGPSSNRFPDGSGKPSPPVSGFPPAVVSRIPSWEHRGNWSEYSVDGFPGMTE